MIKICAWRDLISHIPGFLLGLVAVQDFEVQSGWEAFKTLGWFIQTINK